MLRRNLYNIIAKCETASTCNPPTGDNYIPSALTQFLDNQIILQHPIVNYHTRTTRCGRVEHKSVLFRDYLTWKVNYGEVL